jgi:hypothetical protein
MAKRIAPGIRWPVLYYASALAIAPLAILYGFLIADDLRITGVLLIGALALLLNSYNHLDRFCQKEPAEARPYLHVLAYLVWFALIAAANLIQSSTRFGIGIVFFIAASMLASREYRTRKGSPAAKGWTFLGTHAAFLVVLLVVSFLVAWF